MPSIKDFEKTKKPSERMIDTDENEGQGKAKKARRRPGRDESPAETARSVDSEEAVREYLAQNAQDAQDAQDAHIEPEPEKTRVEFFGSELLRMRAPKAFEFADAVADEWTKDGSFAGLPVPHPVAQMAAQVGFRKAKDLEKKLEEKGVFMLTRVGLEFVKAKLKK